MWRVLLVVVGFCLALVGTACGGDDESAAEELARQREVAAARRDAAREARQAERVKQLQREVGQLRQEAGGEDSTTAPPHPPPAAAGDWPGGSGYTAILGSMSTEAEARQRQSQASAAGLDAGVLLSDDFSSLRPGYWVVFSGTFAAAGEAAERVARARELGYSDAYPRFVAP